MQFQRMLDAGVHPNAINKAKQTSVDPEAVIALVNQFLQVVAAGGATVITAITNLLNLFHVVLPAPSPLPPATTARTKLIQCGVNADTLAECEKAGFDPMTIVTWVTTILNLVSTYGPSLYAAIQAILNIFPTPTPKPTPTPPPGPIVPPAPGPISPHQ